MIHNSESQLSQLTKLTDNLQIHKKPKKHVRFTVSNVVDHFLKVRPKERNGLILLKQENYNSHGSISILW